MDPRPLDEDPKPIQTNLRWHLHGMREVQWFRPKNEAKRRNHGL
jgi:hypothetical protein